MDWRQSDLSDDENQDTQAASRKRSSRACDNCRRTKSKCERQPGNSEQCRGCSLTGVACTYLGPSYKRGPPKGYIHAIEQRWHQVESLLGALMLCSDPRMDSILADLKQDDLAREILHRVDTGPYGPSGRKHQPEGATKEDFFASVLRSNEAAAASASNSASRDASRSRRQSRVSREKVSSDQDRGLAVVPSQDWQDNLAQQVSARGTAASSGTLNTLGAPHAQRRRLNTASDTDSETNWSNLYTIDQDDGVKESTECMGQLSLDENSEIRFHSKASGLYLLSRTDRTDNRIEGGIWNMPMARIWPPSKEDSVVLSPTASDFDVQLPPHNVQDRLVHLYFTYIHPHFPVLHKSRFFADYNASKFTNGSNRRSFSPPQKPESTQKLTPLLLLSLFAIAARFHDGEMPFPPPGKMWEAGSTYAEQARDVFAKISHQSHPSTVQALLLLGHREFGIGSVEQGWILIGAGIRMAIDLGLNCNADNWKTYGHALFSPGEAQTRRQIWWACCLSDRFGSVYMGRPVTIREEDYNTPLPEISDGDDSLWQPLSDDTVNIDYAPVPSKNMTCFREASKLSIITGAVVHKVYPLRTSRGVSRWETLENLEVELNKWYSNLPASLTYDYNQRFVIPPPHILFLHIQYWSTVLLLNRAFIPNWKGASQPNDSDRATPSATLLELKAFDLARAAAVHVSTIVTTYRQKFTLKRSPPALTSHLLACGIMHVLTLTIRPTAVQASLGLQQTMSALKDMAIVWPSASRAWDLLNGVKLRFNFAQVAQPDSPGGHKRVADDAFGSEKPTLGYSAHTAPSLDPPSAMEGYRDPGVQDLSGRIMAHMLGFEVPGIQPSTSYYPGYEWWPRGQLASQAATPTYAVSPITATTQGPTASTGPISSAAAYDMGLRPSVNDWAPPQGPGGYSYNYDFGL